MLLLPCNTHAGAACGDKGVLLVAKVHSDSSACLAQLSLILHISGFQVTKSSSAVWWEKKERKFTLEVITHPA